MHDENKTFFFRTISLGSFDVAGPLQMPARWMDFDMACFFAFRMALAWLASQCMSSGSVEADCLLLIFMHIIFYGSTEDVGRCRRRWMNGSLSGIMGSRMVRVWEDAKGPGNLEVARRKALLPSFNAV